MDVSRVQGFEAVVGASAHSLILGSMPGIASLTAEQYYAHPRNAFWWIIEQVLGINHNAPYPIRLQQLSDQGFLLWDVLQSCERPGSLDSAIDKTSIEINDFASLLSTHSSIQRVLLNGGAAFTLWQKRVVPTLEKELEGSLPETIKLPSTSPAYASMNRETKRQHWQTIALTPS